MDCGSCAAGHAGAHDEHEKEQDRHADHADEGADKGDDERESRRCVGGASRPSRRSTRHEDDTGDRLLRVWQADNATQKQERVRRAQAGRARRAQRWQAGWVLRRWAHTPEAHDYRRRAVRREGTICDSRRITRSHACNKVRLAKRAHGAAGRARAATCRQKNAAMRVRCCAHAGGSAPHHRRSRL